MWRRFTVWISIPSAGASAFEYSDKPDDKTITVLFSLLGLGEVGSYSHQTYRSTTTTTTTTDTETTN